MLYLCVSIGGGGSGLRSVFTIPWTCRGICYHGYSCKDLKTRNVTTDGWYKISNPVNGVPVDTYCSLSGADVGSVTFGTGEDGDLVIDGETVSIESKYPKYDPRRGIYPQYNSVRLINGAVLNLASRYNVHTNIGGLMMFTVKTKLEICSTCRIDSSEAGYPGMYDVFTTLGNTYGNNIRNRPGFGLGGGIRCVCVA